jgi:hypothetical protein
MAFSRMAIDQLKFSKRQKLDDIQKNGIKESDVKGNGINDNGIWDNII